MDALMVLTRREIQLIASKVVVRPNAPLALDAASITLHLSNQFAHYQPHSPEPFVPPMEMPLLHTTVEAPGDGYILAPNGAVLASSEEVVEMPLGLMGFIQTRSSLARGFLMAHPSAGHIEPGYSGVVTFEIVNLSGFHYKLAPGMPIAKLFFLQLASEVEPGQGYNGRYQGSSGPLGMK